MAATEAGMRLFVTLILWIYPGHEVICWSTGGKDYAAKHAAAHLPGMTDDCGDKYPAIPTPGDVFLDDDPLGSYRSATIHPDMLR